MWSCSDIIFHPELSLDSIMCYFLHELYACGHSYLYSEICPLGSYDRQRPGLPYCVPTRCTQDFCLSYGSRLFHVIKDSSGAMVAQLYEDHYDPVNNLYVLSNQSLYFLMLSSVRRIFFYSSLKPNSVFANPYVSGSTSTGISVSNSEENASPTLDVEGSPNETRQQSEILRQVPKTSGSNLHAEMECTYRPKHSTCTPEATDNRCERGCVL
jgi:hypothetical protein